MEQSKRDYKTATFIMIEEIKKEEKLTNEADIMKEKV